MTIKPKQHKAALQLIGRTDHIDIPDAGIFNLPCKIDTGADSSAIHCDQIMIKEINGKKCLVFKLLDIKHPLYTGEEIVAEVFKEKTVKSSFGERADRFQVKLKVQLFDRTFIAAFNLSSRPEMRYPVLLGRKFLKNRFLVDVSQTNISTSGNT